LTIFCVSLRSIILSSLSDLSRKRQRGRIFNTLMSDFEVVRSDGQHVREMVLTLKSVVADYDGLLVG
jgi:hypothetical protein